MGVAQVTKCVLSYSQGKAVLADNMAAKDIIYTCCTFLTRKNPLVLKVGAFYGWRII